MSKHPTEPWRVGDRANDALRINGDETEQKSSGEGPTRVTQRGRRRLRGWGGRINTDAIDNSAGRSTPRITRS